MDNTAPLGRRQSSFYSTPRRRSINRLEESYYGPQTSTPVTSETAMNILYQAIETNDSATVQQVLYGKGRHVNVNEVVPGGLHQMSLLHFAVGLSENCPHIVRLLMEHGGDPNNMDLEEGISPLHISAEYDYDEVMTVLLRYGGDLSLPTTGGRNSYEIVRRNVEEELQERCFKLLLSNFEEFRTLPSDSVSLSISTTTTNRPRTLA